MKRKLKKVEMKCLKLKCLIAAGEAEYFRNRNTELNDQLSHEMARANKLSQATEIIKQVIDLARSIN